MKQILTVTFLLLPFFANAIEIQVPPGRMICFSEDFDDLFEVTGKEDLTICRLMLSYGSVGVCFEGRAQYIAEQINAFQHVNSMGERTVLENATVFSEDIVQFDRYESGMFGITDQGLMIFRCPEFDDIKDNAKALAEEMQKDLLYARGDQYLKQFGLPFWLKKDAL